MFSQYIVVCEFSEKNGDAPTRDELVRNATWHLRLREHSNPLPLPLYRTICDREHAYRSDFGCSARLGSKLELDVVKLEKMFGSARLVNSIKVTLNLYNVQKKF